MSLFVLYSHHCYQPRVDKTLYSEAQILAWRSSKYVARCTVWPHLNTPWTNGRSTQQCSSINKYRCVKLEDIKQKCFIFKIMLIKICNMIGHTKVNDSNNGGFLHKSNFPSLRICCLFHFRCFCWMSLGVCLCSGWMFNAIYLPLCLLQLQHKWKSYSLHRRRFFCGRGFSLHLVVNYLTIGGFLKRLGHQFMD